MRFAALELVSDDRMHTVNRSVTSHLIYWIVVHLLHTISFAKNSCGYVYRNKAINVSLTSQVVAVLCKNAKQQFRVTHQLPSGVCFANRLYFKSASHVIRSIYIIHRQVILCSWKVYNVVHPKRYAFHCIFVLTTCFQVHPYDMAYNCDCQSKRYYYN